MLPQRGCSGQCAMRCSSQWLDSLTGGAGSQALRMRDKQVPCVVQSKDTTLQLHRCYIHGVAHMAAVTMEGGNLRMEGVLPSPSPDIARSGFTSSVNAL